MIRPALVCGCALLAGCVKGGERTTTPTQTPTTGAAVVTIELATDPGLSGLAVGDGGALWTVSERGGAAYRIVLDDDRLDTLERLPISGVPAGLDLEAIEVLADSRLLLGSEGHGAAAAAAWFGAIDGQRLVASPGPAFSAENLGIVVGDNHGVEGVCAVGDQVVLALETAVEQGGGRFAQVVVASLAGAAPWLLRVRLTSPTGKLSALDCRAGHGGLDVVAIERHFEVSRIVAFTVPVDPFPDPVDAIVVMDLAEVIEGRNFEGVARLADGRIALVTDNQWKTLEGPSQLVILPASPSSPP